MKGLEMITLVWEDERDLEGETVLVELDEVADCE